MKEVGNSRQITGEGLNGKEEQREPSSENAVTTDCEIHESFVSENIKLLGKEYAAEEKEDVPYNPDAPIVYGVTVSLMKEFQPETTPSWHNILDEMKRDEIRLLIFQLIRQRRPSPSHDWLDNLQEVSRKVEERLYYAALSLEEYANTNTLVKRIEAFVKQAAREGRDCSDSERSADEVTSENEEEVMQLQYRDPIQIIQSLPLPPRQVSSQGCSRVFIVKVLASVSEFVSGKLLPSIFTFPRDLVVGWLQKAKEACCSSTLLSEEEYYGGPPFIADDASTHWTEPHQLYTWWKNNVERKVKYKILQEDAAYSGPDQRRSARARSSLQAKSLINAAMNGGTSRFESVMKNNPGVTGSPELSHFSRMGGSFSLPSLQYPMNTNLPDVQLQKMLNGHGMRGETPIVPPQFAGRYDRAFQRFENRPPPKKALDDSAVPTRMLLESGHEISPRTLSPHDCYSRPWIPERDFSKAIQNQPPHLILAWKEEAAKAKEALAQKRALFKERSDQIKASVTMNSTQKGYQQAFPLKLYDLVTEQNNDIIGWLPEGTAFKVKHMENFVNIILPAYFKHGNFTSFQRQLNLYGFRRTRESEKGAYYHANFIFGKRDLAAGIRRLLTSTHNDPTISIDKRLAELEAAASLAIPEVPVAVPEPPPEPVAPEPPKPVAVPTASRRSHPKSQKSPNPRPAARSIEKPPKTPSVAKQSKESDLYSFHPEPKHEYGTRRKRLKKQFDEFITSDEIFKRNRKEEEDAREDTEISQNSTSGTAPALPMVYVSGLGSSQDCDEVIDLNSIPNQRRRLVSRRIMIDMTPTLNGRAPVVSESQEVMKRRPTTPKPKDEDGSIYNTTLSSVSHSKLTRVGDEFQAMIPALLDKPPSQESSKDQNDFLPVLSDEMNQEFQAAARRREQIFLTFSTSQVIVAVIPNSNSRRVKRSTAPASCILANKSIRSQLLSSQFVSPPDCVMSPEVKSNLFPRLCVALRRVVLNQSTPTTTGDSPLLFFKPEDQENEVIKSPLWGCVYLHEDDSSDSELDWADYHPGVRDMFTMMSERYPTADDSVYLEVTDGTQNWIVPLAVCASAGSIDYQEYFLRAPHPDYRSILTDNLKNPAIKYSPMELQKLGWIDASMNIFFHQISPLLKRSHENLSRTWRDLQNAFEGNPWPSSMKEFIFFCHRYCPHPTDSTATCDSRIVAMRRLINMTSDLDVTAYKIEELLQDETDKLLLSRYLLPDVKLAPNLETESVEDDNEDETFSEMEDTMESNSPQRDPPPSASVWRQHSLLTDGAGREMGQEEESGHEDEEEETVPPLSGLVAHTTVAVTTRGSSRRKS